MAKIYLAASFSRKDELVGYCAQINGETSHEVTSRWLTDEHMPFWKGEMPVDLARKCANVDAEDVGKSDILIAFTDDPKQPRGGGGRHVEFGMACAWGLSIMIVGPREHVFHCLGYVQQFDTWEQCFEYLKGEEVDY